MKLHINFTLYFILYVRFIWVITVNIKQIYLHVPNFLVLRKNPEVFHVPFAPKITELSCQTLAKKANPLLPLKAKKLMQIKNSCERVIVESFRRTGNPGNPLFFHNCPHLSRLLWPWHFKETHFPWVDTGYFPILTRLSLFAR